VELSGAIDACTVHAAIDGRLGFLRIMGGFANHRIRL